MRWWIVVVVLSAVAYWPVRSYACTCPGGYLRPKAEHSASGVPRNRSIKLEGFFLPDSIVLRNLDGRPHAFTLRAFEHQGTCGGIVFAEVIQEPAFEPNAHYELRVSTNQRFASIATLPAEIVYRFSTSDELLPDPELEPPRGVVTLTEPAGGTTCGPYEAIGCVTVDDPTDVEIVMRDGDTILGWQTLSEQSMRVELPPMTTCVDLQRRAPTGRRSEPLSFCGKDLKLVAETVPECESLSARWARMRAAASDDDDDSPPTAADAGSDESELPEHTKYSCAALPDGRTGNTWYALLALLTSLLLWRRGRHET